MSTPTLPKRRLFSPKALREELSISTWLYGRLLEDGLPTVVISRGEHGRIRRRHDIEKVIRWFEERESRTKPGRPHSTAR